MKREARKTHFSAHGIDYVLERKQVKNINLRVRQDGTVYVSAPPWVSQESVDRFVSSRSDWIEQKQSMLQRRSDLVPKAWNNGEQVFVWGEPLTIRLETSASPRTTSCRQDDTSLVVVIPTSWQDNSQESVSHRQKLIATWLAQQLSEELPKLFAHYEALMGVHASQIRLRTMKTRWGSCNVKTGAITLNTQLTSYPQYCLESVVVHELCHLLEPSHNQRFYAFMDQFYPSWREARKLLKEGAL